MHSLEVIVARNTAAQALADKARRAARKAAK